MTKYEKDKNGNLSLAYICMVYLYCNIDIDRSYKGRVIHALRPS